jgi:hypothetical protein
MQGLLYAILALTLSNVFNIQAVSSIVASVLYASMITLLRVVYRLHLLLRCSF